MWMDQRLQWGDTCLYWGGTEGGQLQPEKLLHEGMSGPVAASTLKNVIPFVSSWGLQEENAVTGEGLLRVQVLHQVKSVPA